jgi:hypothetical protein
VNLGGAQQSSVLRLGCSAVPQLPTAVSSAGVAGLLPAETPHTAVVVLAPADGAPLNTRGSPGTCSSTFKNGFRGGGDGGVSLTRFNVELLRGHTMLAF